MYKRILSIRWLTHRWERWASEQQTWGTTWRKTGIPNYWEPFWPHCRCPDITNQLEHQYRCGRWSLGESAPAQPKHCVTHTCCVCCMCVLRVLHVCCVCYCVAEGHCSSFVHTRAWTNFCNLCVTCVLCVICVYVSGLCVLCVQGVTYRICVFYVIRFACVCYVCCMCPICMLGVCATCVLCMFGVACVSQSLARCSGRCGGTGWRTESCSLSKSCGSLQTCSPITDTNTSRLLYCETALRGTQKLRIAKVQCIWSVTLDMDSLWYAQYFTSSVHCHRWGWVLVSPLGSACLSFWTAFTKLTIWSPYSPDATSITAINLHDRKGVNVRCTSPAALFFFRST